MSDATVHVESEREGEEQEAPRTRTRTCVGCGERVDLEVHKSELVRLILGPNGEVAVDARGGGFGHGAHVHMLRSCLEGAVARGLARAAKGKVHTLLAMDGATKAAVEASADANEGAPRAGDAGEPLTVQALARAIQSAMNRRVEGLLTTAARAHLLARGSEAVTAAGRRGDAALVMVACDAAAAANLFEVQRAVEEGRAVAWGSKLRIGEVLAPKGPRPAKSSSSEGQEAAASEYLGEGVAVIAVLSKQLAAGLRDAVHAADACSQAANGAPGPAGRMPQKGRAGRGRAMGTCAPRTADEESHPAFSRKASPSGSAEARVASPKLGGPSAQRPYPGGPRKGSSGGGRGKGTNRGGSPLGKGHRSEG